MALIILYKFNNKVYNKVHNVNNSHYIYYKENSMIDEEKILDCWIKLSLSLKNERFVSNMSVTESIVCRIIYQGSLINEFYRQVDIVNKTKMLKSAVNRLMNGLEAKRIVEHYQLENNRKSIYYRLSTEAEKFFLAQHDEIINLVKKILAELTDEEAGSVLYLFNKLANISERILEKDEN